MSLRADVLTQSQEKERAFERTTRDILGMIDEEIKKAHEHGNPGVVVSIPITFTIPCVNNATAQREIYYRIIRSLDGRGFEVALNIHQDATFVDVKWVTKKHLAEMAIQNAMIAKFTKKSS
jgi:hypothetical protein